MTAQRNGLFLYFFLATIFPKSQSQMIVTTNEKHFCYNASLETFRLNATILQVKDVVSKQECLDKCLDEPCCRSINYEHSTSPAKPQKCELLHELLNENACSLLVKNTSFDHAYIIEPRKAYDDRCFHKFSETLFLSCEDVLKKNSSASDGIYTLQSYKTKERYQVFCVFNGTLCGKGAWTLVMLMNGNKDTFQYNSSYWTNNKTLNVEGLSDNHPSDIKLASYHYTPFNKICFGMKKVADDTKNFIVLNYTASSLYSVIAGGNHSATNAGRAEWMSLLNNHENNTSEVNNDKEGFNIKVAGQPLKIRIGWVGCNAAACMTPNPYIGFGVENQKGGNIASSHGENIIIAGFIFVQ
ncbi:uncharacterized protein LOC114518154 [Dendronephthya gigantea]|uniref:uncharacterized protein LOC114518154 n=1 Tax=Dendronephthya gigantea TaxID=151771 RepID=UPI00106D9E97|nr:uncharacterized protein LOC114518154 [Dendronephthya gigantea]